MFSFVTCFWLSLSSMGAASLSTLPWPVHNPRSFPTFDKGSSFIKQDAILGSLLKIFGVKILDKIHGRHHFIPLPTFTGRLGPAGHGSKLLMQQGPHHVFSFSLVQVTGQGRFFLCRWQKCRRGK